MQRIWGSFVARGTPIIPAADATAHRPNASVPWSGGLDGGVHLLGWPAYTANHTHHPIQMILNTTGGTVARTTVTPDLSYFVRTGPGVVNHFRLADALSWEGGRGRRCAFWMEVSGRVPV